MRLLMRKMKLGIGLTLILLLTTCPMWLQNNQFIHEYFVKRSQINSEKNDPVLFKGNYSTFDYGRTSVGKILAERRKLLLKYCEGKELLKAGYNPEKVLKNHFLYDSIHNLVYCAVEKVGCTFWKRVFMVLSGQTRETDPFKVNSEPPTFGGLSFDAIYAILNKSTKFVITREPFARLFSGYANKLFQINPSFWITLGAHIIKLFRPNATSKSLRCGHDTSFEELVKFVIHAETEGSSYREGHFVPMTDHCRPCQIKYDIIAKLETLKEDTIYVLDKLNVSKNSTLRIQMENMENNTEDDSIKGISYNLLTTLHQASGCVSRGEGLRRTWRSFQYRGYIGKQIKYPLNKSEEDNMNAKRLYEMFQSAVKRSGNREDRLKNRQFVLEEAFSQISLQDLNKLRTIFSAHCGVFGYDCEPKYIFDRTRKPTTDFLNWRNA